MKPINFTIKNSAINSNFITINLATFKFNYFSLTTIHFNTNYLTKAKIFNNLF